MAAHIVEAAAAGTAVISSSAAVERASGGDDRSRRVDPKLARGDAGVCPDRRAQQTAELQE